MATDEERLAEIRKEEQKAEVKGWFKEAMKEYLEENKPADPPPSRTQKAGGFLDSLFS